MKLRTDLRLLVACLGLAASAAPAVAQPADPDCTPQPVRPPVAVTGPVSTLRLWVVRDPGTRAFGLMCVRSLGPGTGMIFVFPGADHREEFWMKDTLIPLDMVWVSRSGRVTGVAANVPATRVDTPDADIPRRAGQGSYVIELGAGDAARNGLAPGARLDLRAVGSAKE